MKLTIKILLISLFILAVSFVSIQTTMAFSGDGSGTEGSPYQITNWTHISEVDDSLGSYYILMNDIDKTTDGYSEYAGVDTTSLPIGDAFDSAFTGNFDGQNHTISDFIVNRSGVLRTGFFGATIGATISNLGLINGTVYSGAQSGIFIGETRGSDEISNCFVRDSFLYANGVSKLGGFIGNLFISSSPTIRNCYSEGSLIGGTSTNLVGGFIGFFDTGDAIVNNSYAANEINSTGDIGGFSSGYIAGSRVENCFWDTTLESSEGENENATGKTTSEMKNITTFTYWDISNNNSWNDNIWYIDNNEDYPRLFEPPPLPPDEQELIDVVTPILWVLVLLTIVAGIVETIKKF